MRGQAPAIPEPLGEALIRVRIQFRRGSTHPIGQEAQMGFEYSSVRSTDPLCSKHLAILHASQRQRGDSKIAPRRPGLA
jgi:hypothetical protein